MSKIALFFGSFNPVHLGHTHIAKTIITKKSAESLWFIPSPQNPFKDKSDLMPFDHRKAMLKIATETIGNHIQICDIEETLPKPNYSAITIKNLKKKHPKHFFTILIGEDNVIDLPKWNNFPWLNEECEFIIFPRKKNLKTDTSFIKKASTLNEEIIDISSSQIRQHLKNPSIGTNDLAMNYLNKWLSPKVLEYLISHKLYSTK